MSTASWTSFRSSSQLSVMDIPALLYAAAVLAMQLIRGLPAERAFTHPCGGDRLAREKHDKGSCPGEERGGAGEA
ncbi:unnamed protein product [Vitrella brassicaformis CCMP3155]|uniref:Uncharacterized protein n=1 Tax=Vitrella brassicaformis (strain CCMP3155) TaxID=1169540 RepID=A0A0G4GEF0_VITBC|nr:unnamed protein product [Vitrella brassicaformis CCMP3155]|eukprot:CEM27713.1 unnamed protein product [Vitrella brassicaformis CCMP3155]